jgi:hypothetical protein
MSLIYIHIGKTLPEYIYDSIYQSLLITPKSKIYVLSDHASSIRKIVTNFTIDSSNVECIPLSILQTSEKITRYSKYTIKLPENAIMFRDGFWISTTTRFFYIEEFMRLFELDSAFHIENDVMLYEDLYSIRKQVNIKNLTMVQDNFENPRVVPSIIYIPDASSLSDLNNFILNKLENSNQFINDMNLLGLYPNKECFPYTFESSSNLIFDGAAIGQFLGGVDPSNLGEQGELSMIKNPSRGFINETCDFKITRNISFFRKPIIIEETKKVELFYALKEESNKNILKQVANLHIHSKQLYQFSSIFNVKFDDIITGDRILTLVDFIISTPGIYSYHKGLDKVVDTSKVILIQNFNNVNTSNINQYFDELTDIKERDKKVIKLFIYTHILDDFINNVYDKLSKKYSYVIYLHNSDHAFGESALHKKFMNDKGIKMIYAQNASILNSKVTLLPIGLANSMFGHGDIISLYKVMSKTYKDKKQKGIYININPNTFAYRSQVLNEVNNERFVVTKQSKPFKEYLEELSTHRFSLCVRGNGLSSHREWESYYLGVIPVIINNKYTDMDNHVKNMRSLGLPFYEIKNESLEKYSDEFFNEQLYRKIISECETSIYNLPQLKLSYYS